MKTADVNTRPTVQARAIAIGTAPLGDFDLIIRMLVQGQGKISVVARNGRKGSKRLGHQVDIFDIGRLEAIAGRSDLWNLTSFIHESSFRTIRTSLEKVAVASMICEAFDHILLDDAADNSEAFEAMYAALRELDDAHTPVDILGVLFGCLVSLLSSSGFAEPTEFLPRSVHTLERLLNRLQEVTERPLRSRSSIPMLVQSLRSTAA